jgi:hypothetical protein
VASADAERAVRVLRRLAEDAEGTG